MSSQPNPFVPGIAGETRNQAVARRLRGQLAELRISQSELERRSGIRQQIISSRLRNLTPFDLDEIDLIARAAGIDANYLLTGVKKGKPPTGGGIHQTDDGTTQSKRHRNRPSHISAVPNLDAGTLDRAAA